VAALIVVGVALVATIAAFAWLLDRRDRRERVERAELLQRIQAPHAAVAEHHHAVDPPVDPGSGLPMTDTEIAELQRARPADVDEETRKWIAQVEAIENGTAQLEDGVIQ
jgi:hypothetical protein